MTIKQLKKELGLSQKDISEFYNMSYGSFANSTAKTRYENALCKFYELIKKREEERRKEKEQCSIPVISNCYFHKLKQKDIDALIADKKTIGSIMEMYKQPDWCKHPNALEGQMGCWSLMDLKKDGLRTKISKDFCKECNECYL